MKKKMNKSELIRGIVSENPGLKAAEVVAILKKQGVVVSAPLVYQTLKKSGSLSAKSTGKKTTARAGMAKTGPVKRRKKTAKSDSGSSV